MITEKVPADRLDQSQQRMDLQELNAVVQHYRNELYERTKDLQEHITIYCLLLPARAVFHA